MDPWGGGSNVCKIANARVMTKSLISMIIRGLRSGKQIKEIVRLSGATHENVRIILHRYPEVNKVSVETYRLRHPEKEPPGKKLANVLREV